MFFGFDGPTQSGGHGFREPDFEFNVDDNRFFVEDSDYISWEVDTMLLGHDDCPCPRKSFEVEMETYESFPQRNRSSSPQLASMEPEARILAHTDMYPLYHIRVESPRWYDDNYIIW
jgi:hypothetical protein